ncbi:uncharacterized protein LOC123914933 [Trifolium pratense]|uniref:uncharacterized protein LOC123914933 n=1 Tax=Trifolium pratense TaxID=57577 RepID=UPI001E695BEF|nr:uncharacterized protein LOC123914933 [Trifolium pratense]
MCLVPDVVVPPKFKAPDFDKYKGTGCPKIHIKRFYTKMAAHASNEKLLIHIFQDSLSGASFDWYMQLERAQIKTWKDLVDAFLTQYSYNLNIAPNRMQLQNLSQRSNEAFKEYAQRWRELAAQVQPPLMDRELVDTFMSTLQGPYYEKMIGSISSNFADLVIIGERVEAGIKNGKIQKFTKDQTGGRRSFNANPRKKEEETNAITTSAPAQISYSAMVPPQPQQRNQSNGRNNFEKRVVQLDRVPVPYGQILPYMLQKGMIELKQLPPVVPPYPAHFKSDVKCDYHSGALGHTIENCKAFKYKVQELIDQKLLTFKEEGPNVKTNPLPGHAGPSVNTVEDDGGIQLINEVSKIRTPLAVVREKLIGYEEFEMMHSDCEECARKPENCKKMRMCLQQLMDQGLVQIGYSVVNPVIAALEDFTPIEIPFKRAPIPNKEVHPLVFRVPKSFPFESTQKVPWNYQPTVSMGQEQVTLENPSVDSIAGIGGMTRSGRIFSHDQSSKVIEKPLLDLAKGKHVEEMGKEQPHKVAPKGDAEEFLKIIRKSDYQVVDQLGQTPCKISMLSLLLSSEIHRNALMKVLGEAHVEKDVTVNQFDGIIANIASSRYLGFNDEELPAKGCDHNKALYISVKCLGNILSKVLIDNGSSLNVMPKRTFDKLNSEGAVMRPSTLVVKAFDGSERTVMGEIDLPVLVGPQLFTITFQVMDINPAYSCLLGRPWIHSAGVVTSTLHQKLKFMSNGKIIIVSSQEDIIVSHLSAFQYIEEDEQAVEIPFQALEVATVTMKRKKKAKPAFTSWQAMKEALDEASLEGWGKVPVVQEKKDRFGLGYRPSTKGSTSSNYKGGRSLQEMFRSAKFNNKEQVNMIGDNEEDAPNLVRSCANEEPLNNWKAEEISEVSFKKMKTSSCRSIEIPVETYPASFPFDFEHPVNQAEGVDEDDCELPEGLARLLKQEEKAIQPHQEQVKTINLGSESDVKEVKVGASLQEDVKKDLVSLLQEYVDVFAWSYQDMPGLDTDIVVHKLPLKPECAPVKQEMRRTRPDMALKIKEEVKKQFDAGFLTVAKYPQWVANIVPVPKKDGKVRMCVDYRDLNRASPKDDFPLPHIDVLVDNTAQSSVFSFMDGFSGYNQIKMNPEDMEKTTFITPWGTFCYKVMPFGLKNAGATYQRAMVTLFHDMIHKEIEVYVDDMIAKSQGEEEHLVHLRKLFARLRKFKLRLNPNKCTFGVRSGKLLGFIVSQRGIEVDPDKVKAIQEMPAPKSEKEVRGFLGRLNYIARFISHLTSTCEPIFKLLRKDQAVEWNDDCQKAFDKIKEYLQEPPVLIPPVPGRPLLMYMTVLEDSMGCVLGQQDETGKKEHAIYFLSKKFTDCESRYTALEKTCCALAWAARRLRQYMLTHTTHLISKMDPIKYIFEKPAVTGKIARWQMLLSEYDIQYVAQKAIKGSVLAEYLAHQPLEEHQPVPSDFPDEDVMILEKVIGDEEGPEPGARWKLVFDGASNAMGHGVGAVLISPRGGYRPLAARLCFECTNNIAEYEACIMGLEAAIDLRIKILEVYGDSALVICQVKGEWEARHPKIIPYCTQVKKLAGYFDEITFHHIPREENQVADALATLSSMYKVRFHNEAPLIVLERKDEPAVCTVASKEYDDKPWFHDIKRYLEKQEYPEGASINDRKTLRRLATQFFLDGEVLYKRNYDMVLLRCVDRQEADHLLAEIHAGTFGTHANGHAMARKILRAGYYWLTMEADCYRYVKTCHKCQIYADKVHVPPNPLNVLTAPWPFSMWGIDVIGMIEPKASNGHRFILVAIDYFTKWVEAASYANVTQQVVARFIKKEIIYRYGIPNKIITDNGSNLNNKLVKELCDGFKIEHHNSSPYRPQMNGAVEAANKNIKRIIQKMVKTYKDWHEMLPYALHGYRTTIRTSTGATPFSLVYGMEAVLPVEVEIPSLRVLMETKLEEAEWAQTRFDQLNLIEEKRLTALCHGQLYQQRRNKAFDKKVRPREFREGELVLKKILPIHKDSRGKWTPNYEGPYVVKKAFSGGALILATMDEEEFPLPVNADVVKKYYA